jgi:tetratricopeptide (TPR) repeat protein
LVGLTWLAFLPALRAGFIWDDDWYLTRNPHLDDWRGFLRLWIPGHTPQYYPAVFTTFWLEKRLWGLEPAGYHALNLALHSASALLVWRLALRQRIPAAWLLAALFAIHPVQVESVAWITERKNVLSGLFYLLSAQAYLRFEAWSATHAAEVKSGAVRVGRWSWYGAALALFLLALLAKSVTCSLPAVLILLRLHRRERVTVASLAPLAPFFLLGLGLGLHTAYFERAQVGASGPDFDFSFLERVLIASRALVFYPRKLLVPFQLAFIYPRWEIDTTSPAAYASLLLVLTVSLLACIAWRRGARGPALTLAYFGGTLFPALGFLDVYPMRYSFVADHFQYLASLGPLALLAAAFQRWVPAPARLGLGAVLLATLGALTWRQAQSYRDLETLWRTTLRHNPEAWMAHSNLAKLLSERGENEAALAHLERADELSRGTSSRASIRLNRALVLGKLGRHAEALLELEALQRDSGGMELRIAQTLERLGRDDEAERSFRALLAGPDPAAAWLPFGLHLLRRGRAEEAVELLERHLAESSDEVDALMFLADGYAAAGRLQEAISMGERGLAAARRRGDPRLETRIGQRVAQYRASLR